MEAQNAVSHEESRRQSTRTPAKHRRPIDSYSLTDHARLRAAQRNLSEDDIRYVLQHGQLHYSGGARIYFLRKTDIPDRDRQERHRIEGAAVVMAVERSTIITVWRNRQTGSRRIRRKSSSGWITEQDSGRRWF